MTTEEICTDEQVLRQELAQKIAAFESEHGKVTTMQDFSESEEEKMSKKEKKKDKKEKEDKKEDKKEKKEKKEDKKGKEDKEDKEEKKKENKEEKKEEAKEEKKKEKASKELSKESFESKESKKRSTSEEVVGEKRSKSSTEYKVTCTGNGADSFKAANAFDSSAFHVRLAPLTAGFTKPTPIQAHSWPVLAAGRDMIGIAETGSGKTLAFSLPLLSKILSAPEKEKREVKMLVVAPTRELAMQTFDVISKVLGDVAICLYGGTSRQEQARQVNRQRPSVVIGTPGRLVDFLNDSVLKLSSLDYFVLDEADRMLDLGFEPEIRTIVAAIPEARQTVMFSATWPPSIQSMASKYLRDPVKIHVRVNDPDAPDNENDTSSSQQQKASTRVHQIVQVVKDPFARDPILLDLLKKYHSSRKNRVLIFVLYKKEADRIEGLLKRNRWHCVSIHGDKPQRERTEALAAFKSGEVPLMIATDVAARGLDIPDVEFVINFTFPLTIEDYIHRIGRTGRGGSFGTSHTLFTDADKPHSGELINVLKASSNTAEIPAELYNYGTTIKKKVHKEYGAFYKDVDPNVKASHMKFSDD